MRERTLLGRKRRSFRFYMDLYSHLWFRYHNLLFGRLISKGKKILAFNKFIQLKKILKAKESLDPFLIFLVAMIKVTPVIFLRPLKLGASMHGVPVPIKEKKQITFAIKWVAESAKGIRRTISVSNLANNLILSLYDKGPIIEKKVGTYKIGGLNRHLLRFYK